LNNTAGVSAEARTRIKRIADDLGYRPSSSARSLRTGRSNSIGLLVADIGNPFYPEVAAGVIDEAASRDYQVFLSHVGDDAARDAVHAQLDRDIAGFIFSSATDSDLAVMQQLVDQGVPMVQIDRRVKSIDTDWVGVDEYLASRQMGRHLIDAGYQRIGLVGGLQTSDVSRARIQGIVDELDAHGLRVVNDDGRYGSLTRGSGTQRAAELLRRHPDLDAVACGNDVVALGVLDYCWQQNIRVPDRVAVCGFDDMSFSSAGPLQLTTVTVPRQAMGREGARMLFDRIAGNTGPVREVFLQFELQARLTT
jgi:LacI family transcriptional regulator